MTCKHLLYNASLPLNAKLQRPGYSTVVTYEDGLARQRGAVVRLRQALARAEALLRQKDELIQALQQAIAELSIRHEEATNRIRKLTPRRRQVMELVLAGHHNKNIAAELGISQRTVESHRAAIMKATGSKSLPELARLALTATGMEIGRSSVSRS